MTKNILTKISDVGGKAVGAAGEYVRQKQKDIDKLINPDTPEKVALAPSEELDELKRLFKLHLQLQCLAIEANTDRPEIIEKLKELQKEI